MACGTNAYVLTRSKSEEVLPHLTYLRVNISAGEPKRYAEIMGVKEDYFHRVVENCLALQARRRVPEAIARWPAYLQYLRPYHLKRLLRRKYETVRGRAGDEVAPSFAGSGV